jgi:hypothetical protein
MGRRCGERIRSFLFCTRPGESIRHFDLFVRWHSDCERIRRQSAVLDGSLPQNPDWLWLSTPTSCGTLQRLPHAPLPTRCNLNKRTWMSIPRHGLSARRIGPDLVPVKQKATPAVQHAQRPGLCHGPRPRFALSASPRVDPGFSMGSRHWPRRGRPEVLACAITAGAVATATTPPRPRRSTPLASLR